jgi:hypothetical protein
MHDILDVDEQWTIIVVGQEQCRCVGFLEEKQANFFEIVDENNRRIDSV